MRKKACQIALCIIHRGYKMNPSCPPFECAHMWGPALVSSLKDSSLHSSLRKPAFDLIQIIVLSDASALVTSTLNSCTPQINDRSMATELKDDDDDEGLLLAHDVEEKDASCWNEFSLQSQITSREYEWWMCIPMLWFDVLVEIDPSALPISFSKAVFWALSQLSMVEPENNTEMALPIRNWLITCCPETSHLFEWKIPSGSDDGGDGKESRNSVKVTTISLPLMRVFRRLAVNFVVRMEQGDLRKQWTWEPRMGESLILSIVDPDDNARQVGRRMLEQVSNTRGLLSGLQFLCSCSASLSAIFLGLRHALKLLQLDSVLRRFHSLHHFFFVLCKLLKEGVQAEKIFPGHTDDKSILTFSSQGGFLPQPVFDFLPDNTDGQLINSDSTSCKKFSCLLSEIAWPSFCKCLAEGKAFIDYKISQMTCIRLLEILPVVLERLCPINKLSGNSGIVVENGLGYIWLHDLMEWGKSSLAVVVRYWKQAVLSVLDLLRESCNDTSTSSIRAIEKLILCDKVAMDELTEHVARVSVSLMNGPSYAFGKTTLKLKYLQSEGFSHTGNRLAQDPKTFPMDDSDVQILDSATYVKQERDSVVVLSDDEMDIKKDIDDIIVSPSGSSQSMLDFEALGSGAAGRASQGQSARNNASSLVTSINLKENYHRRNAPDCTEVLNQKLDSNKNVANLTLDSLAKPKSLDNMRKENLFPPQCKVNLKKSVDENVRCKIVDSIPSRHTSTLKKASDQIVFSKSADDQGIDKVSAASDVVIKELVCDAEADPWAFALKSARHHQSNLTKLNTGGPKRQVIQLNLPVENRSSQLNRLEHQRFKPPRLDEWFKPILEIDYFVAVGLASASEEKNRTSRKLKEVPLCFQSPDDYVAIFQPLVLEEFKAQLHSSFVEMASLEEMSCGSLSVLSVERIDDFHIVRCVHDDSEFAGSRSCLDNDLILFTRQPLQNSSLDVHMVGKVERREKDNKRRSSILVIRFYLQNGCSRLNRARKLLLDRSKWYIIRLMNITPQLREFQALSSIKSIPLLPTILNPGSQPVGCDKSKKDLNKLAKPLQQILKSSYNDGQFQAITAATGPVDLTKDFDLSLIQGPPGTGKTRTIVAIVSVLLAFSEMNSGKRTQNSGLTSSNTSFSRTKAQVSQSAAIARAWQDAALARQINADEANRCKSMGNCTRGRVLICAQSNAAVDELVSRISSNGLYGSDGLMYKPYLVRVGNAKTVHPSSLPFFIDTLVDHRLAEERLNVGDVKNDINGDSLAVLRSNIEKIVDRIRFYESKRANLRDGNPESKTSLEGDAADGDDVKEFSGPELEARLRKLYGDKKALYIDLATAQAQEKKANEESKALKLKLRRSILREAEIIITTLSGCGGDLYGVCSESIRTHKFSNSSEHNLFDAVVIDEAAQALEPATLIPLQLLKSKGSKCIMVGDPKQLPATVLSNVASKYLYQCSMFERLQKAGHPVTMLTKQYRMHPEICRFPSLHFYDGKLLNGDQMSSKEAPFHKTKGLGPYVFFDIVDGQELHGKNSGALSLYNKCEAEAAVEVLRFFKKSYPSEFFGGRIGIITPYRSQLSLLRSRFSNAFGSWVMDEMELNTVDGFQGREVDILVLSTVRAAEQCPGATRINSSNIGFVADVRRMNVALTRAKISLWILGNARTLQTNENWRALVQDAKERKLVVSVKKPYNSMFNSHSKQDQVLEFFHNNSEQMKHSVKNKEVIRCAEQRQKNLNYSGERKRKYTGADRNYSVGGDEHTLSAAREADKANKKEKHQFDLSAKKYPRSVDVENSVKRTIKDVKSAIEGDAAAHDGSWCNRSGKKQLSVGDPDSKQLRPAGSPLPYLEALKLSKIISENDGPRSIDNDIPSERNVHQGGGGRSSNQVGKPTDTVCKRKQQRDAVDALLSSALITSKKSETSSISVPVKKSRSQTNTSSHAIRPTKPRKV